MDYDDLVKAIHDAPMTMLPQLLIEVMEAGYAEGTWREGRCHAFLEAAEKQFRAEREEE